MYIIITNDNCLNLYIYSERDRGSELSPSNSFLCLSPACSPSCSGWWTVWWWGSTRRRRAWRTRVTAARPPGGPAPCRSSLMTNPRWESREQGKEFPQMSRNIVWTNLGIIPAKTLLRARDYSAQTPKDSVVGFPIGIDLKFIAHRGILSLSCPDASAPVCTFPTLPRMTFTRQAWPRAARDSPSASCIEDARLRSTMEK